VGIIGRRLPSERSDGKNSSGGALGDGDELPGENARIGAGVPDALSLEVGF
jgi:hypothetical protein